MDNESIGDGIAFTSIPHPDKTLEMLLRVRRELKKNKKILASAYKTLTKAIEEYQKIPEDLDDDSLEVLEWEDNSAEAICVGDAHEAEKTFIKSQEPLGEPFEKILHDNISDLYEE